MITIEDLAVRTDDLFKRIKLAKDNPCHKPSGPGGGQFCETGGSGGSKPSGAGLGTLRRTRPDPMHADQAPKNLAHAVSIKGSFDGKMRTHAIDVATGSEWMEGGGGWRLVGVNAKPVNRAVEHWANEIVPKHNKASAPSASDWEKSGTRWIPK